MRLLELLLAQRNREAEREKKKKIERAASAYSHQYPLISNVAALAFVSFRFVFFYFSNDIFAAVAVLKSAQLNRKTQRKR